MKPATLDSYIGDLLRITLNQVEPDKREQWAKKTADALLVATNNAPDDKPSKGATVQALETARALLAVAQLIALEGQHRCALMGYPTTKATE